MASVGVENLAQILAGIRNNIQPNIVELNIKGLGTDNVYLALTKYIEVSPGEYTKQEVPLTEVYHNDLGAQYAKYEGYTHRYSIVLPEEYMEYTPYIQFRAYTDLMEPNNLNPLKLNVIFCPYCETATTDIRVEVEPGTTELVTKNTLNYYTTKANKKYINPSSLEANEDATVVYTISKVLLIK